MGIDFNQDDGIAENERPENKSHESKELKPNNDAKNGDQGVYISNFFIKVTRAR